MKNLKKMLTAVLSAALLISALSVPASAANVTKPQAATQPTTYFADVPADHPAAEAINTLAKNGIVDFLADENGLFHPDDPVTFAEMYTMFYRLYGSETFVNKHYGSLEAYCEQENTTRIIGGSNGYGDRCIWIASIFSRLIRDKPFKV